MLHNPLHVGMIRHKRDIHPSEHPSLAMHPATPPPGGSLAQPHFFLVQPVNKVFADPQPSRFNGTRVVR
ncbi:MAG: hypothetical protein ABI164_04655 [Acidobacteriaceae bacterium]